MVAINTMLTSRAEAVGAMRTPLPQPSMDLTSYPTSGLQQIGFFMLFFFPAVALLVVSLRLYSRLSTKAFGWDDALIVVAMAISIAEAGCSYVAMKLMYVGVYDWQVPTTPVDPRPSQIWRFIVIMLYHPQLALIKSSVLLFLLRIGGQKASIRRTIHILNAINIALMIATFFSNIFTCTPVAYFWDKTISGGRCNFKELQYIIPPVITVLTDIAILVLPSVIIAGLHMPRRARMCLIVILSGGVLVLILGIIRIAWFAQKYFGPPTERYHNIRFLLSTVEANVAIASASVPALYSLLRAWFPKAMRKLMGTSRKYGNGGRRQMKSLGNGRLVGSTPRSADTGTQREMVGHSPSSSSEDIVISDGIMKTTEVDIVFNDTENARSADV